MQMDQGTQQNAALVEEATSASQSMKQQAQALIEHVAFFKTENEATDPAPRGTVASKDTPTRRMVVAKPAAPAAMPTISWPGMMPGGTSFNSPSMICKSVRQTPQALIRSRTWSGPGIGIGTNAARSA